MTTTHNGNGRKYLTWREYIYTTSGILVGISTLLISILAIYYSVRPKLVTAAELQTTVRATQKIDSKLDKLDDSVGELAKTQAAILAILNRLERQE